MNEYKALLDEGVLILRFFDEYVADEGDQLLMRLLNSMTIDEIYSLKIVIWDLSDVTSMSLHATDGARMANFNKKIISLLEHPGKDAVAFMHNLELLYIQPNDALVRDIWIERLERLKTPTRSLPNIESADVKNLHELLKALGLLKLEPILEREWQTI